MGLLRLLLQTSAFFLPASFQKILIKCDDSTRVKNKKMNRGLETLVSGMDLGILHTQLLQRKVEKVCVLCYHLL